MTAFRRIGPVIFQKRFGGKKLRRIFAPRFENKAISSLNL